MEPFVIEPQEAHLKVVVSYTAQDAGRGLGTQVSIVGGDEFMVRWFTNHWGDVRDVLGNIAFKPGKLYSWRGHVCIHGDTCFKATGSWYAMEWFTLPFDLDDEPARDDA